MNIWIAFFNTPFFSGLATILSVLGAYVLYRYQKKSDKEQIAILLINDIRNAQEAISDVKISLDVSGIPELPEVTVLPENNWKKYSHLFVKDFDQDETELINKYFSDVERVSYIVTKANDMFLMMISDRNRALQSQNLKIIANAKDVEEAVSKLNRLDTTFGSDKTSTSPYVPSGFYTKLKKYLPEIPEILNTTVGSKLKKIAKLG